MTVPKWLEGKTLKTRPDRPDDPPLEGPVRGANRAPERLSAFQRRVQREALEGPGRRARSERKYERILAARRTETHPVAEVQSLAVRLFNVYRAGTRDLRSFGDLDNRVSIFGTPGTKTRWWNVAEAVLRQDASLPTGCIRP